MPTLPLMPRDISQALHRLIGEPQEAQTAMGVGGPGVTRWSGPQGTAIVKRTSATEAAFYRGVAPILRQRGLAVLDVYANVQDSSGEWLILEALPMLLPRARWGGDPSLLQYLSHLHTVRPRDLPDEWAGILPSKPLRPDAAALRDAASLWSGREADRLSHLLEAFPWPSQENPGSRLISGDPNPTNWGLRDDGTVVLFDWAEAGWGHPAYDLPILIPGLPSPSALTEVVERYCETLSESGPDTVHAWIRVALSARVTTIVHFLAKWTRGCTSDVAKTSIGMLQAHFLSWLEEVSRSLA